MNIGEAKKELNSIKTLSIEISILEELILRKKEKMISTTSIMTDRVKSSSSNNKLLDGICSIESLEELKRIKMNEIDINNTIKKIARIDCPLQRSLLILRYQDGVSLQNMGIRLDVCDRYVYKLHSEALVSYCNLEEVVK
jgi:DNA-directed RNA polymerase specialized sigma subunit